MSNISTSHPYAPTPPKCQSSKSHSVIIPLPLTRWEVNTHDLALMPGQCLQRGPAGMSPHLGRVVIGRGDEVITSTTCKWTAAEGYPVLIHLNLKTNMHSYPRPRLSTSHIFIYLCSSLFGVKVHTCKARDPMHSCLVTSLDIWELISSEFSFWVELWKVFNFCFCVYLETWHVRLGCCVLGWCRYISSSSGPIGSLCCHHYQWLCGSCVGWEEREKERGEGRERERERERECLYVFVYAWREEGGHVNKAFSLHMWTRLLCKCIYKSENSLHTLHASPIGGEVNSQDILEVSIKEEDTLSRPQVPHPPTRVQTTEGQKWSHE